MKSSAAMYPFHFDYGNHHHNKSIEICLNNFRKVFYEVAFEKKDAEFIHYLYTGIRKRNYAEHILAHLVFVKNNVKY
jgi:hypothetical protein